MVNGIDVSHLQGEIDWATVAGAGYGFAIAKASEGTGFTDHAFPGNLAGAKAAALLVGSYDFLHPDQDAAAEAARFIASLSAAKGGSAILQPGELPGFVDLEWVKNVTPPPAAAYLAKLQIWLDAVETATGRTPGIYTSASFWNPYTGSSTAFGRYPLWVAEYGSRAPKLPAGWSDYAIWQNSGGSTVPGIAVPCDLDVFNGELADLQALAGQV